MVHSDLLDIIIAYIKIFGQFYLVSYGVVTGKTFLQACWDRKWLKWLFFVLMLGCIFHSMLLAGLLGNVGGTIDFVLPFSSDSTVSINIWILIG